MVEGSCVGQFKRRVKFLICILQHKLYSWTQNLFIFAEYFERLSGSLNFDTNNSESILCLISLRLNEVAKYSRKQTNTEKILLQLSLFLCQRAYILAESSVFQVDDLH